MAIVTCPKCGAKNRVDESAAQQRQPVCGRCGTPLTLSASSTAAAHPVEVGDATFDRDVLHAAPDKPVLVDAWAAWCGPCRMIAPAIDELAADAGGRYLVTKLNVDQNPRTAARYRIEGIPALLIFKNGQLVDQLVGVHPKPTIAARLNAQIR